MKRRSALVLGVLVLAAPAALPAQACPLDIAPRCFLPLDVGQGFVLNAGDPTPYTATARLAYEAGFGDGGTVRLGPVATVSYANPEWEAGVGGRLSLRVLRFGLPHWGLFAGAEQVWTGDRLPGALTLVLNAGAVRVGGWWVHDWESESSALQLSIGSDLRVLHALLFPPGETDPFGTASAARPLPEVAP